MCTADSLGGLAYLGPAVEQLQRLDVSNNPMLRLHPGSESACQLSKGMHQHVFACTFCTCNIAQRLYMYIPGKNWLDQSVTSLLASG